MLERVPSLKLPRWLIPVAVVALLGLFVGVISASNQELPLEANTGADGSQIALNPAGIIQPYKQTLADEGDSANAAQNNEQLVCLDGKLNNVSAPDERGNIPFLLSAIRAAAAEQGWDEQAEGSIYPQVPAAPVVRDELYELGRLLAFDKVLSGNRDTSCMTCHNPNLFSGDERMLGFGAGGRATQEAKKRSRRAVWADPNYDPIPLALGTERTGSVDQIIPRHAPPLYNLHAYHSLFWDGRIQYVVNETNQGRYFLNDENLFQRVEPGQQYDQTFDIDTPHGALADMEPTFEFGIVSALSLFPTIDHKEMIGEATRAKNDRNAATEDLIGQEGELLRDDSVATKNCVVPLSDDEQARSTTNYNDLAAVYVANDRLPEDQRLSDAELRPVVWQAIVDRVECEAPSYLDELQAAYPGQISTWDDVKIEHISNAIAGYLVREFESNDTPWSEFLNEVPDLESGALRTSNVLTKFQVEGGKRFFELGCARCHGGALFSDFDFHNTALRQVGPGKGDGAVNSVEEYRNGNLIKTHLFTGDYGRERVTNEGSDRFNFRTSTLINVGETWTRGHAGQFLALDDFIKHYQKPIESYETYEQCFVNALPSNPYGFTAEGGAGNVLSEMFWQDVEDDDPSNDAIITTISPHVLSLNEQNEFTDEDVVNISRFLRALTSEKLCDFTSDNYYLYEQPATVEPIVKRNMPLSTDGTTWLDDAAPGQHKGDAPRIENPDTYDLSHQVSQIPIDWFYREACQADPDHAGTP
ncbi:MAG: cytochrome-c peroxidase [Ardenticatenaceae bacterium]